MKIYVLMFQEIIGEWVSVYHVDVYLSQFLNLVIHYASECLMSGNCDGRYVGNRCVVYCTDDHAMWELVLDNGVVEVYS